MAHPPCSRWCRLAKCVEARWGHKVGDDGGCFAAALEAVRTWGGVLEHPAWSKAWPAFDLPTPVPGQWTIAERSRHCDGLHATGWVCEVSQSAYGHRARKRTWLYYGGTTRPPFDLNWDSPAGTAVVGHCRRRADGSIWRDNRRRMPKKEASATPLAFRDTLISLATHSRLAVVA